MKIMNPPETNDPLDALLREQDKYIEDNGFTARVVAALPRRRRALAASGSPAWRRGDWFGAGGWVVAVGKFAGSRFVSVAFAQLSSADAVDAGALGHGFPGLGHDFRAGMGRLKPRRTIQEHILNPLSMRLLEGEFKPGDKIKVTAKGDELVFEKK